MKTPRSQGAKGEQPPPILPRGGGVWAPVSGKAAAAPLPSKGRGWGWGLSLYSIYSVDIKNLRSLRSLRRMDEGFTPPLTPPLRGEGKGSLPTAPLIAQGRAWEAYPRLPSLRKEGHGKSAAAPLPSKGRGRGWGLSLYSTYSVDIKKLRSLRSQRRPAEGFTPPLTPPLRGEGKGSLHAAPLIAQGRAWEACTRLPSPRRGGAGGGDSPYTPYTP